MKYVIPLVFLLFFIAMLLMEGGSVGDGSEPVTALNQSSTKVTYAEQGILNTWPGESGQEISPALMAKNYYVIVDGSGSMLESGCSNGDEKITVAKDSLSRFIDKIPQSDNIGLYVFDGVAEEERVALASDQHSRVKSAVWQIQAGGTTPLSAAVIAGTAALTTQGKRQLGYGEYHLVIVTDGAASNRLKLRDAIDSLLRNSPITVHTIGFCIKANHTLNQPGYVIYKSADNPQMLEQGLEQVLAEAESFGVTTFEGN